MFPRRQYFHRTLLEPADFGRGWGASVPAAYAAGFVASHAAEYLSSGLAGLFGGVRGTYGNFYARSRTTEELCERLEGMLERDAVQGTL